MTQEEAEELLLQPRDRIAVDVETVSLDNILALGVGIAIDPTTAYYFFNPKDTLLKEVIETTATIIVHNAKFDVPILRGLGIRVYNYEDTKLLAYSSGILANGLVDLARDIFNIECPSVSSQWRKKNSGNIAIDHVKMGEMCMIHALLAYNLWDKLPKTQLYKDIDKPCIDLLIEMEHWGLLIDQYKLTEVEQAAIVRANKLEQDLKEELGDINLASNPQVAEALALKGIIGTRKTKAAKDSVSEESLKPLNHPLANKLLKWRSVMKTLTTYVPAFRSTDYKGRLHTRFGLTNTGRWSSAHPNLQNITRDEKFKE